MMAEVQQTHTDTDTDTHTHIPCPGIIESCRHHEEEGGELLGSEHVTHHP
jgi:hypothetical protein